MVGYKFNSFVAYPKTPKLCLQKNLRKIICNLGEFLVYISIHADVAKLVDALDLGSSEHPS